MNGNELPCEQIAYGWYDSGSLTLNDENMPKVILNGKVVNLPIYH